MRRALFLAAILCLAVLTAMAQDPAKVDPKHCKVEFENDQVRALRWNLGAHEKIPMHEHPAHVTVYLTDAHLRTTLADGKTAENHAKAGETSWGAATKHAAESIGDKPNELIQIELKASPSQAAPVAKAQDPVSVDPKHNKVEFENDQVRVLRTHVAPKESIPMHEHPPSVVVLLTDAHSKFTLPDGKTRETTGTAGEVRYRPAEKHAYENLSD